MELKYDEFTLDSSVGLQNQFYQHSVYCVASSFLFNRENEQGLDRDLIFDKKSLLSDISPNDVDAVVRLCPYLTVQKGKIGIELLVRKAIVRKDFKTGGTITAFLDKGEVTYKGSDGVLKLTPSLFNYKQDSNFCEQEVVKSDRFFVCAILDKISTQKGQVHKVSNTDYKTSQELINRLLAFSESFRNLFLKVNRKCEGFRCLQQIETVEQKCHTCETILSSDKGDYTSAGDKQCLSSRYKLRFECTRKKLLKSIVTAFT